MGVSVDSYGGWPAVVVQHVGLIDTLGVGVYIW